MMCTSYSPPLVTSVVKATANIIPPTGVIHTSGIGAEFSEDGKKDYF